MMNLTQLIYRKCLRCLLIGGILVVVGGSSSMAQIIVSDPILEGTDATTATASGITSGATTIMSTINAWMQQYLPAVQGAVSNLQHRLSLMHNDAIGKAAALNADQQTIKKEMATVARARLPDNHKTCATLMQNNASKAANDVGRAFAANAEIASVRQSQTANPIARQSAILAQEQAFGFVTSDTAPMTQWDGADSTPLAIFNPKGAYNLPHTASVVHGVWSMPTSPTSPDTLSSDEISYVAAFMFCQKLLPVTPAPPLQTAGPSDVTRFHIAQDRIAMQGAAYHDCMDALRMRTAISAQTAALSPGLQKWYNSQVQQCYALANKNMISGASTTAPNDGATAPSTSTAATIASAASGATPTTELGYCIKYGISQYQVEALVHGYGHAHTMLLAGNGAIVSAANQPLTPVSDSADRGADASDITRQSDAAARSAMEYEYRVRQEERLLSQEFAEALARKIAMEEGSTH